VPFIGVHDMERFMNERGATVEGLKLAQTFMMTARGTPLLYYGDEIAMPGAGDPDNRRDFPGGFPGDARNAFEARGRTAVENDVFNHLRRLARLRAELPALRRGSTLHVYDEEQQTVFARVLGDQTVLVAFNNDTNPATFDFDLRNAGVREGARLNYRHEYIFPGVGPAGVRGHVVSMSMKPRSAALLVVTQEP
jgi:glycosidase